MNVTMPGWSPILLRSADEFRPPAPPDCHSPEVVADTEAVKQFERTFVTNYKAHFWQSPSGLTNIWYDYPSKWMFEDGTDRNPPRAERVYALVSNVFLDSYIASNDAKFAYWYLRPSQLDASIATGIPVPPFPSYPSNHSALSTAKAEILAHLFPSRAELIRAAAKEAGDSRVWAGIHYEMDNRAGVGLGRAVANRYIGYARSDGAD